MLETEMKYNDVFDVAKFPTGISLKNFQKKNFEKTNTTQFFLQHSTSTGLSDHWHNFQQRFPVLWLGEFLTKIQSWGSNKKKSVEIL